jgi:hypothetical protein
MSVVSAATLFVKATKEAVFSAALDLAQAVGLPVTSWRTGDPTLVEFQFIAEQYEQRDIVAAEFAKAGFLSTAEGDWLKVHAAEVYGVEAAEATYATPTVTIANGAGGVYDLAPGELTVKSSATGVTFHNTSVGLDSDGNPGGALSGGVTLTYELVADVAGSTGTVAVNDIDELVTRLLGVTIVSSTAAVGSDEQSPAAVRTECSATLGALSASGPKDAYESICLDAEKTGTEEITRAKTADASSDGTVTVYVARAAGTVSGDGVTAAQDACITWAEPIGFEVTVVSAAADPVDIEIEVEGDAVPTDIEGDGTVALGALFAAVDISDGVTGNTLAISLLSAEIHKLAASPAIRRVTVIQPAADVTIPAGYVPTLGTVSITEV